MAAVSGGNMQCLSASTVRLLGSTQVITSVYSVVKELIENSLDAGAKAVEVKLENYGLDKIEVRDNGKGIHTSDIPVIAKRHYTSKITSHADLETLASYGFRGEALASLCAVSEVTVTTKTEVEDISQTYTLNGEGDVTNTVPSHLGQGTTVCAKNLFKNLPVRKQYHNSVKKKKEDLKNVENLLLAYSVILPTVRLSLRHNKEVIWQKAVLENTAAVLQMILGKSVTKQMEWSRRNVEDPQMQLELCMPKAGSDVSALSRSTADRSFLCINGRPVVVKEIDKLIRQYYNNCHACETTRYPVYYMSVAMPSKDVDVNLDPNKTSIMATSMPTLLEQLEEMLLYVYGPLDQAPSWKYRDQEEGSDKGERKDKPTTSKPGSDISINVMGILRKTSTDQDPQNSVPKNSSVVEKELSEKSSSSSTDEVIISEAGSSVEMQEADHSSAKSKNDSLKFIPEAHNSNGGKTINVDAVQEKQHSENGVCTEQQVKELSTCDDPNSNVLKEGGSNRLPLPQDIGESSEPAAAATSELLNNNAVDKNGENNVNKQASVCEAARNGEVGSMKAGDGEMSSDATKKTDEEAGSSAWTHGTSVRSGDGAVVQPVRLLAPSPLQLHGKRPLPASSSQGAPPVKRGRKLSPAKSTLYDMINNTAVKRPLSARDFFFKDKRSVVVEQNPEADYDKVTDILASMWDELPEESRVAFREKCWFDTQRYNKEVAAAKNVTAKIKASVSGKTKPQLSVRDMVAASSTQLTPGKTLKKKVVPSAPVTDVCFSMTHLKNSLHSAASLSTDTHFEESQVLGGLPSCQAWMCGRGKELCILNAHRLSEAIVFQRLMNQHRLSVHHCQPVTLTHSNTGGMWSTVEKLAGTADWSTGTFSHLSDCRITHNGLDVKCWRDGEGQLCAELVGVCGDVPTYGVKDLVEVLDLIEKQSSSSSLAQSRPLKVINYLKGEAVRMVRQQAGDRSLEDIQDMLDESSGFLPADCCTCLHDRPFFHCLLADIGSVLSSEDCTDDGPEEMEDRVVDDGEGGDLRSEESGDGGFDVMMSIDDLMDFDD